MSKEIVERVLASHADLIVVPNGEKFEDRRRSMLTPVIDALPGGRTRYGILKKTGSVPSDIVTDLQSPTHEHIDVFSGTNLGDGTSLITAAFKSQGDYRRHSPHWERRTLQEALDKGWIDPLPSPSPAPSPDPAPPPPVTADIDVLAREVADLTARVNRHLKE